MSTPKISSSFSISTHYVVLYYSLPCVVVRFSVYHIYYRSLSNWLDSPSIAASRPDDTPKCILSREIKFSSTWPDPDLTAWNKFKLLAQYAKFYRTQVPGSVRRKLKSHNLLHKTVQQCNFSALTNLKSIKSFGIRFGCRVEFSGLLRALGIDANLERNFKTT